MRKRRRNDFHARGASVQSNGLGRCPLRSREELDAHLGPSVGSLALVVRPGAVGASWEPLGSFLGFS